MFPAQSIKPKQTHGTNSINNQKETGDKSTHFKSEWDNRKSGK